jgi:hypothetical protein
VWSQAVPPQCAPSATATDAGAGDTASLEAPRHVRSLFQMEATPDHRHHIVLAFLRSCPNPGFTAFQRSQSAVAHPMCRKVYKVRASRTRAPTERVLSHPVALQPFFSSCDNVSVGSLSARLSCGIYSSTCVRSSYGS